jgi:hypothetical protein
MDPAVGAAAASGMADHVSGRATRTPHRLEAFLAAQYAVDRIKHIVPVWKKEHFESGAVWVGAACDPETHARELAEAPYAAFLAVRDGAAPRAPARPSAHQHAHVQ